MQVLGTTSRSWQVRADPGAVAAVRAEVRNAVSDWGGADAGETTALLVSETVTNAIRHADEPLHVRLVLEPTRLRVETADGAPNRPLVRPIDPAREGGRGMHLVESLADRWGTTPHPNGKVVWFELDRTTAAAGG